MSEWFWIAAVVLGILVVFPLIPVVVYEWYGKYCNWVWNKLGV